MVYIRNWLTTGMYCKSGWTPPPYWSAHKQYTSDDIKKAGVKPTTPNGHNYILTKIYGSGESGYTGNSEPFSPNDENWDKIPDNGVEWTCFDEFTNPTKITGEPFGHGFTGSLWYLASHCNDENIDDDYADSTYLNGNTYNVNLLSSQYEVAVARHKIYNENDLIENHEYTLNQIWKKGDKIIFYASFPIWYEGWAWFATGTWIGWTPCWWWQGGSRYEEIGYEEITDEGSDYSITIELYDGYTLLTSKTDFFSVINLHHTKAYWNHIQDYTDNEINSLFGMKASSYVHDLGDDIYITATYKQKNLTNSDIIYIDGMEGTVNLKIYHSGYVKQTRTRDDVVDKDINGPFDFTGDDYLQASVEGIVKDEDNNPVENANVWATNVYNNKYGCKTSIDGKYALPLHTKGSFSIRATKNNFNVASCSGVSQSSKHPLTVETRNFTDSNCLTRMTGYPTGEFAHLNTLAVDNQSVIIPDDPVTGDGNLIKPYNVATSIIKIKTHKWGTGASQSTTSTGTYDSSTGYGSGGFNYGGDMGDAEEWEEEEE